MPPLLPALDAETEVHGLAFCDHNVSESVNESSRMEMETVREGMRGPIAVINKGEGLRW